MAEIQLEPLASHLPKMQKERKAGFRRLTTLTNSVCTPEESGDELGAAEPSPGDSLLNAFKSADFNPSMTMRSLKKNVRTAISQVRAGKNNG
jgi:hypothetical protein